jgi:hypothetical protein
VRRRIREAGLGGAAIAICLASAPAAWAQGATFSITPLNREPFFVFHSTPGHVLRGRVRVVNVSATPGSVALYPVDATTGQTSGAVYQSTNAERRDVGAWIRLSRSQLTLGPHGGATVAFSVTIPPPTRQGEHLGGLVARPLQLRSTSVVGKGKHSFRVNVEQIAIVAVQVDLPGVDQRMDITSLSAGGRPGYQTLALGLANIGDALVKGRGTLTVSNASGKQVLNQAFPLDTFVPHTQIAYPVYVRQGRLAPGGYRGTVTIYYGDGHRLSKTFGFAISSQQVRQTFGSSPSGPTAGRRSSSSIPTWALGLGGAGLVGLSVGGSALYFRRRPALR